MNKLPIAKRTQIIQLAVEGTSLRVISRISDVSINTVTKLLVDVGKACQAFHDATVVGVKSQRIQCDEICSFVCKEKIIKDAGATTEGAGDILTWTGIDTDSKLIVSWYVGNRDAQSAYEFIQDIKGRITNRLQLTLEGLKPYLEAIDDRFESFIDFAQLAKIYGSTESESNEKRYFPAEGGETTKKVIAGRPEGKHIYNSHVELHTLTTRVHMRRFTHLTNAFSRKIENHCHVIALHFVYYNFSMVHKTLRVTPAMEAGLASRPMNIQQIVELTD